MALVLLRTSQISNKYVWVLLRTSEISNKYVWAHFFKTRETKSMLHAFSKQLNSIRRLNKKSVIRN